MSHLDTRPLPPIGPTNGATDQVIAASVPTKSTLPADSPGHNAPTSSQASAAASLPAGSPGLQQMTDTTSAGSSTASSSTVKPKDSETKLSSALAKPFGSIITLFLSLFGLAWVLFGLAAFVMSLVCFGYSGSVGEKIFGLIASIIMGPFYWIYYFSDPTYCKKMAPALF